MIEMNFFLKERKTKTEEKEKKILKKTPKPLQLSAARRAQGSSYIEDGKGS